MDVLVAELNHKDGHNVGLGKGLKVLYKEGSNFTSHRSVYNNRKLLRALRTTNYVPKSPAQVMQSGVRQADVKNEASILAENK